MAATPDAIAWMGPNGRRYNRTRKTTMHRIQKAFKIPKIEKDKYNVFLLQQEHSRTIPKQNHQKLVLSCAWGKLNVYYTSCFSIYLKFFTASSTREQASNSSPKSWNSDSAVYCLSLGICWIMNGRVRVSSFLIIVQTLTGDSLEHWKAQAKHVGYVGIYIYIYNGI